MGRKSRPWVVLVKDKDNWWPRSYFDSKEQAENWAIEKSKKSNSVFRVERNSPTNPSIFARKRTSVYTQKANDKLRTHSGMTIKRN